MQEERSWKLFEILKNIYFSIKTMYLILFKTQQDSNRYFILLFFFVSKNFIKLQICPHIGQVN